MPRFVPTTIQTGWDSILNIEEINRVRSFGMGVFEFQDSFSHTLRANDAQTYGGVALGLSLFFSTIINVKEAYGHCKLSDEDIQKMLDNHLDEVSLYEARKTAAYKASAFFHTKSWKVFKAATSIGLSGTSATAALLALPNPIGIACSLISVCLDVVEDSSNLALLLQKQERLTTQLANQDRQLNLLGPTHPQAQDLKYERKLTAQSLRELRFNIIDKRINLLFSAISIAGIILCAIPSCNLIGAGLLLSLTLLKLTYRHVIRPQIYNNIIQPEKYKQLYRPQPKEDTLGKSPHYMYAEKRRSIKDSDDVPRLYQATNAVKL